jgi:hypothetical protein
VNDSSRIFLGVEINRLSDCTITYAFRCNARANLLVEDKLTVAMG